MDSTASKTQDHLLPIKFIVFHRKHSYPTTDRNLANSTKVAKHVERSSRTAILPMHQNFELLWFPKLHICYSLAATFLFSISPIHSFLIFRSRYRHLSFRYSRQFFTGTSRDQLVGF